MITEMVKGDSATLRSVVGEPILDWKVRCEIWDDNDSIIKKASANTGGSDLQVKVTNEAAGEFVVLIDKGETTSFQDVAQIEIEVETPTGEVYTVLQDSITFKTEKIDWDTP